MIDAATASRAFSTAGDRWLSKSLPTRAPAAIAQVAERAVGAEQQIDEAARRGKRRLVARTLAAVGPEHLELDPARPVVPGPPEPSTTSDKPAGGGAAAAGCAVASSTAPSSNGPAMAALAIGDVAFIGRTRSST